MCHNFKPALLSLQIAMGFSSAAYFFFPPLHLLSSLCAQKSEDGVWPGMKLETDMYVANMSLLLHFTSILSATTVRSPSST